MCGASWRGGVSLLLIKLQWWILLSTQLGPLRRPAEVTSMMPVSLL